ncbi:hypothetical protein WSM22_28490 [Cytophagales bacterium WSM2-2]|nr:hypothetical protein WSM22_28490 [Cytophagales bacterium WSM2-2]
MMLIHFPSALLPVDLVFSILSGYLHLPVLAEAAYYCLWAGVVGGWAAMVAGFFDFVRFIKPGTSVVNKVIFHACIQIVVVICFTLILTYEYKHVSSIYPVSVLLLTGKAVTTIILFAGNYIGGEIVLKHIAREFQEKNG